MVQNKRTAFILQIHTNPKQVNRFIQQLISNDQADVYIHIDKRTYHEVSPEIINHPHVKVLKECVVCEWGDISQIDATLLLLEAVIASRIPYDYVCLRSGQDLLVKNGFKDFLSEHADRVFLTFKEISSAHLGVVKMTWPKKTRKRYTTPHPYRVYRRVVNSLYKIGINLSPNRRYWPENFQLFCGSQWFSINYEAALYMLSFLNENPWYYEFFEETYTPDEWFFHTLLMNSPYRNRVINENFFFFKWGETFKERNSPQYLKEIDIPLIESSQQFFARKFDETIDSQVIGYFADTVTFTSQEQRVEKLIIEGSKIEYES